MFPFTRSRSRLRIKNSRSQSRPKTGRLRNPQICENILIHLLKLDKMFSRYFCENLTAEPLSTFFAKISATFEQNSEIFRYLATVGRRPNPAIRERYRLHAAPKMMVIETNGLDLKRFTLTKEEEA